MFEEAVSCYRGSLAIYREVGVGDPALRGDDRRRPPPQSRTESGAAEQPFTADSCTCITRAHSGMRVHLNYMRRGMPCGRRATKGGPANELHGEER
jgi:hypothetical protein